MLAKAALAQFDDIDVVRHFWPMVRSSQHLERLLPELKANPGLVQLEHRFGLAKKAHEKAKLMLEIFYELINAGQDFQTADEILEQSAEVLLKELKADLYVCRLRDESGHWVNIAANTHTGRATPIFVKFMEETLPHHPVMRSVNDPHALFVVSNNLLGPERGGESIDCVPYLEGYRCRLSFFLREPDGKAFGLMMLYSKMLNLKWKKYTKKTKRKSRRQNAFQDSSPS